MNPAARFYVLAGVICCALICLTVLAALQVVDGERVLDLLGAGLAAAIGAFVGAKNGKPPSSTPRPPVVADYSKER